MGKFLVKDTARVSNSNDENSKPIATSEDQPEFTYTSEIPPDIIFPDQLNRYFRDQIHSLTLENGGLRRSLEELQEELITAREQLAKATQPAPMGRVAEMADYKIAQLSKRLREQNAEMECLRTQTKEAEAKLRRLEDKASEQENVPAPTTPNELAEKDRQIKVLTDKLQASNAKMCDFRNQYQSLKQELKVAQKVIENEVGEKVPFQDLSKENGNWRGRAQQILALQNKVQQLQEQLNNSSVTENPASTVLRQIEKDRRTLHEETTKQLNQKTIQVEDLRKKFEAAKARNKILESEIMQLKTKLSTMTEKGSKDEQLLSTLTNQINAFEDRGKAQMQCFSKLQESMSKLQQELELERTKNDQLQRALNERENRIHRMEEQIDRLRRNAKMNIYVEDDETDVRTATTVDKATDATGTGTVKHSGVADMERMRLLELLGVINRRLDESRKLQYEAECQLRKERRKSAKLETKVARLELEKVGALKTGRGSYCQGINRQGETSFEEADLMARQHIEYLEEECLALKTRIETLQMERESDFKALASIGDARAEGHEDGKGGHRKKTASPKEKIIVNKDVDRNIKLNRKNVYRSLSTSNRSLASRQSSVPSEEFKFYETTPDYPPCSPEM